MRRLVGACTGSALLAFGLVAPTASPASATPNSSPTIIDSPVGADQLAALASGDVNDIAVGPDGTSYVVGDFALAGASTGGLAAFNSGGSLNRQFPQVPGHVRAIERAADGWYVAIDDGQGGNSERANILRIQDDGSIDTSWPDVLVQGGNVYDLALVDDTLYVGGQFLFVNGASRDNLAALDATSGTLSAWNPKPNQAIHAIATDDSAVYVGGAFTQFDGLAGALRARVAAFERPSGTLLSWDPNVSGTVYDLEVGDSLLYIAGIFSTIGGQTRGNLGAVATVPTGSAAPTSWNPDVNYIVRSLSLDDTTLYIGGEFEYVFTGSISRATRQGAAAFRTDTGAATSWDPNVSSRTVYAVEATPQGVYLGGAFSTVGGQSRVGLALVDSSLGTLQSWDPRPAPQYSPNGPLNYVSAIEAAGSSVLIGSSYTHMLAQSRPYAAAFDSQGLLTSWNPHFNRAPLTIALDGTVAYVGGEFTTVNGGLTRNRAAAVRTDDTGTATAWNPNVDAEVRTIALADDTAYLGGDFTTVGGVSRNRAAAVRTDDAGSVTGWDPDANQPVHTITLSGSTAYLGGLFSSIGGVSRSNAASVSIDDTGTLTSWDPGPWGNVPAIEIRGDVAYLGGQFNYVNNGNVNRVGVAAVDADDTGGVITGFNAGLGCSGWCGNLVAALEFIGDNLYVGGEFTTLNQTSGFSGLAVVSPTTGSRVETWTPALTSPRSHLKPYVKTLESKGTTLYAGGYFTSIAVDDEATPYASYATSLPGLPLPPEAPTGVAVTAGNASASVAWTPGWDGDAPVTRIEFAIDDTTMVDDSTTSTSSPYTLTELDNGTSYTVYVRLVNSAGWGPWSAVSNPFTPEAPPNPPAPIALPGAPTDVTAVPGNTSATITWTPPNDTGSEPVYGYVVRSQPGSHTCSTATTSCTITGLTNGTAYTFTVTAWNYQSPGGTSVASAPVTPRTVPGAPVSVAATAGVERARITWSPPADDGGSPVTGYRVELSPASAGCITDGRTSCTLRELTPGQEYSVTVMAINAAGESTASSATTVTPSERPTIVITGSRTGRQGTIARIDGRISGLDVAQVQPYFRIARARSFEVASRPAQVVDDAFTWQRVTSKRMVIYVTADGVTSNRVVIAAR